MGGDQKVAAEELEIEHEGAQQTEDEYGLSDHDEAKTVGGLGAQFRFAQEGLEDLILVGRNDFAAVDDALSALHHARSGGYGGEEVVAC